MCPDFLDLSITDYKTKSANAWKGGLLAAVAPAVGVSRENWAAAWLKVRAELGASLEREHWMDQIVATALRFSGS